jgi:TrmH family RNA methyltransferase
VRTPGALEAPAVLETCLMLEDLQDPGNLGSILRTAAAAGVRQVFLSRHSVHCWSPRVLRAGMGAHFALAIYEQAELPALIGRFPGTVVATDARARRSLYELDLTGPVAFLFGNEGAGLSPVLARAAHVTAAIPIARGVESLNVAAAAAVALFERVRQTGARRAQ